MKKLFESAGDVRMVLLDQGGLPIFAFDCPDCGSLVGFLHPCTEEEFEVECPGCHAETTAVTDTFGKEA